jgi:hypothetical protein
VEVPNIDDIKVEVFKEPIPHLKVMANGLLLGLVRKLSNGYTFTSDEIGSITLPDHIHTDDIPRTVHSFITEHKAKWVGANNQDSADCACEEQGSQCDVCDN